MSGAASIVVVDDEPEIRDLVQEYLVRHGYAVTALADAAALRAHVAERPVDLAILDITMPGEDGLSLARFLRARGPIGIIMLTANAATVDRVVGLEVGADDYVAKPFDLRELLARVRSVLRRIGGAVVMPVVPAGPEIAVGAFRLNLDRRKLFGPTGAEVPITAMELDLLAVLVRHPGRVLARGQLMELAHGNEAEAFERSIDTRVARLRAKIETDPSRPTLIRTVRGAGYVFDPRG